MHLGVWLTLGLIALGFVVMAVVAIIEQREGSTDASQPQHRERQAV